MMGSTNNAAAGTAVKNMTNRSDLPTDVEGGFFNSPLSGSVGFGGDNNPNDVFKVSEALVANGRLDEPTFDATDAFNSKIITAQQDMADGLKPDGLVNPGGPTETRFTNLVQGDMMKAPAVPRPATGSRAGNAAVVADSKAGVVDAARTTVLQNTNDPERTSFQQAQDMKRLNTAKDDAAKATARAEREDIKQREKAQHDQIMAAQKARQQAAQQTEQQSKQFKETTTKAAKGVVNLLETVVDASSNGHARAGGSTRDGGQQINLGQEQQMDSRLRENDKKATHDAASLITDEVFSANQRSAQYLASRDGVGEFSKFVADGIEADGEKAIAETVDLYRQTADRNQEQADAMIDKVIPDLSAVNAKRLQSAIKPIEHNKNKDDVLDELFNGSYMDENGNLFDADGNPIERPDVDPGIEINGPRMDEAGNWYDADRIRIPDPDIDPGIKMVAGPIAPVPPTPVPGVPPVLGGINPATPQEIDKALKNASEGIRNAWDEAKDATGLTDAGLLNTPLGKTIMMGKMAGQGLGKLMDVDPRTDIAEQLSPVPEFPTEHGVDLPNQTPGRSTEPDRVIDPPDFVPPPTGAETGNQPFPNQSDDFPQGTVMDRDIGSDWKSKEADSFWKGHQDWMKSKGQEIEKRRMKDPINGMIQPGESYIWSNLRPGNHIGTKRDAKGNVYFWDRGGEKRHPSQIEKFTKNGKHLGAFDPLTGERIHGADSEKNKPKHKISQIEGESPNFA